eukprot:3941644-Rhodomonas_salina.19
MHAGTRCGCPPSPLVPITPSHLSRLSVADLSRHYYPASIVRTCTAIETCTTKAGLVSTCARLLSDSAECRHGQKLKRGVGRRQIWKASTEIEVVKVTRIVVGLDHLVPAAYAASVQTRHEQVRGMHGFKRTSTLNPMPLTPKNAR